MKNIFFLLFIVTNFHLNASNFEENIKVNFESDVAILNEEALQDLENKIQSFKNNPFNYYIEIEGHTDMDGDFQYNQILSEKRANYIAKLLSENHFDEKQIIVKGLAYSQPIAENSDEEGKSKNRRVEIKIYDNSPRKINSLGNHHLQTEKIKINTQEDTLVTFQCGIKAFFPKTSFVDNQGNLIEGIVEVALTPYNNYKDFILGDAPMSFLNEEDDFFISGGMFNIEAQQNNKVLNIAENSFIDFDIPATSLEEEMQLFEFNNENNEWETLENTPKREVELIERTAKRHKGIYDIRPECTSGSFKAYDINDSTYFNKIIANYNDYFVSPDIFTLSQKNIFLNRLNENLKAFNNKLKTFEIEYEIKNYENKNGLKCITFDIGKGKNQTFNESKFLEAFYLTVNEYPTTKGFDAIRVVSVNGKEITLELVSELNNEIVNISIENIHNKKFSKKALTTIEEDFKNTFTQRQKMIKSYQSKIVHLENKIVEFEEDLQAFKATFDKHTLSKIENLKQLCLMYKKYENKSNKDIFRKTDLKFEEFEKWIVKHYENQKALKIELVNINNTLKCSDDDYVKMNYRIEEFEYTYMTTPLEASLSDVRYSFRTQNLGMFNVDKLMKLEENFIVQVEKYVNERNEVLPITNLYVVNKDINGVLEFSLRKRMNYNIYKFPIQGKNNALVAVDIHGNTYQLKNETFNKMIETKSSNFIQLSTIQENETLAMF